MDERRAYAAVTGQLVMRLRSGRMSQETLAANAGLSQSALSRFENGQTLPDAYELRGLAVALGLTPPQLVEKIEVAFSRTREAAKKVSPEAGRKASVESPWAGIAAAMVAGLAVFGVAAMLDEAERKNTRKKS
jgi:transcriptional regulator with XRE-family HTH domain